MGLAERSDRNGGESFDYLKDYSPLKPARMQIKQNDKVRVNLSNLIKVFDERNDLYKGHTTSIAGVIGEDINAAIFADYLIRRKIKNVEILLDPVNMGYGGGQGPRLDRWIKAGNILYQSEIKSWCSFQIGRYRLLLEDDAQKIKNLANRKWAREKDEHYKGIKEFGKVSKVLAKMEIPDDLMKKYKTVKPLVIHWMPISSNKRATPFFSCLVKNLGMNKQFAKQIQKDFNKVYYFSCSLYIRELIHMDKKELTLSLPNVCTRMSVIKKLIN